MASTDLSFPNITIREQRTGIPVIRGVSTSEGAFIGRAQRGPANKAIRISSPAQYTRIFGDAISGSYLAESVKAFFDNGGTVCWIVRVLGSTSGSNVKASLTLTTLTGATQGGISSSSNAFPVQLLDADTFICTVDALAPVTATISAVKASRTGAAATYAVVTAAHTLKVIVTITPAVGVAQVLTTIITFAGTENTQALFHDKINATAAGFNAVNVGGQTKLLTDSGGSGVTATIDATTSADVLTSLGLTSGAFTTPGSGNVANNLAVTESELAVIFAAFTGSTATPNTTTHALTLQSNLTGTLSKIQFTGGTAVTKIAGFDTNLHAGTATGAANALIVTAVGEGTNYNNLKIAVGTTTSNVGSLGALVVAGSVTSVSLSAATAAKVKIGDTLKFYDSVSLVTARGYVKDMSGTTIFFTAAVTVAAGGLAVATTTVSVETWTFTVYRDGVVAQGPIRDLRMSSLAGADYFVNKINTGKDEALVTVADLAPALTNDNRPVNVLTGGDLLASGAEATGFADADYVGLSSTKTGFYALDKVSGVRLLACPGVTGTTTGYVSRSLIAYCTARESCVAIISTPLGTDAATAATYRSTYLGTSSYAALYWPWIQVVDVLTKQNGYAPPEAWIMGMISRSQNKNGISKAPAGEEDGLLIGANDVEVVADDSMKQVVCPELINVIENLPNVGVTAMGANTLENGDFYWLHVRLAFIYLEQSMKLGTRWALFAPTGDDTRNRIRRSVEAFLRNEWRGNRKTLGGKTEEEAFTVVCDDTNNTPEDEAADITNFSATVKVPRAIRNLVITVSQKPIITAQAA